MPTRKTLSVADVNAALVTFTPEELLQINRTLSALYKQKRTMNNIIKANAFAVGQKVKFKDSRDGGHVRVCVVKKVKRVNVSVTELPGSVAPGKNWNVSGSFLKPA